MSNFNIITYNTPISNATNSTISNLNVMSSTVSNLNVSNLTISGLNITGFINNVSQPINISQVTTAQVIQNNTDTAVTTYWSGAATTSGISQSSGVFTVTNAGTYFVSTTLGWSLYTIGQRAVWVVKNNDTSNTQRYGMEVLKTNTEAFLNTSFIIQLAAYDNLRTMVWQNSGTIATLNVTYGGKFEMIRLC